jgi:hypothetical protein
MKKWSEASETVWYLIRTIQVKDFKIGGIFVNQVSGN